MLNRYILEGIASDLEGGAEIGVFTSSYPAAVNMMCDIMHYTDESYTKLRLFMGEIVHDSGGRARFYFKDVQARGCRFDTVLVPYGSAIESRLLRLGQEVAVIEY